MGLGTPAICVVSHFASRHLLPPHRGFGGKRKGVMAELSMFPSRQLFSPLVNADEEEQRGGGDGIETEQRMR